MHISLSGSFFRHRTKSLALTITLALTAGCSVTPSPADPKLTTVNNDWETVQSNAQSLTFTDTQITEDWWTQFNDETLNQLVLRAENNNLDLQLALNRIEQAQAQLGIRDAQNMPKVSGTGSAVRENISDNGKFAALGAKPDGNAYWQAAIDISWELDLWGRLDQLTEGAQQGLNASVYDMAAVKVMLRANVVSQYFELRGAQQQLSLTKSELELNQQALTMITSQFNNGVVGAASVAQAKAKVANLEAQIPPLEDRAHQLMNQLALLSGEAPQALSSLLSKQTTMPVLPSHIPLKLDGDLARQRPDIMSASAQLKQATASVGVAQANFYPSVSLNGRAGFEAFDTEGLTDWDAGFFSVGPAVYLPIFEAGTLKKRLKLTEQKQTQAALHYRKTVLNAWHEVDDALAHIQAMYTQHQSLQNAYQQMSVARDHTKKAFAQGSMSHLDVIKSNEQVTHAAQRLQQNQTQLNIALVTLYKSLGGGWQQAEATEGGVL
ncbi:efflux transporter outer membrane subunit [Vibrio sp.]|uniref:efflux transporter outer membrane subunit n=1 Tax=Vibrio sp. TaxID=678 RepID=UPI003AA895E5